MTEELEQLLKNLKLRRMLNVYDEQLKSAEKANLLIQSSLPDCCVRNGMNGRRALWNGASAMPNCRALVTGNVPLSAPARR